MKHDISNADQSLIAARGSITISRLIKAGFDRRDFFIYLLTPGFSLSYHQHVLGVSDLTMRKYLGLARQAVVLDPTIQMDVTENVASITAADGLRMALSRGRCHLPHWSRLAICEAYSDNANLSEVAKMFSCSPSSARSAVRLTGRAFDPLSGKRRSSSSQSLPKGRWIPGQCGRTDFNSDKSA